VTFDMNELIRAAAGRGPVEPPGPAPERVGNIGIGRGGAAAPARRSTNAAINERIRAGARLARGFTAPGGVHLDDVNDLLGPTGRCR
jgi:hypothetical protein